MAHVDDAHGEGVFREAEEAQLQILGLIGSRFMLKWIHFLDFAIKSFEKIGKN